MLFSNVAAAATINCVPPQALFAIGGELLARGREQFVGRRRRG